MASAHAPTPEGTLARRIGSFAAVYTLGLAGMALMSIATLAVLARFLSPHEFGRLAVLLFFTGLVQVSIIYAILPGTMSWVFGGTGDDFEAGAPEERHGADDPALALCTGLWLSAIMAGVVLAVVALLRAPLSELLLDRDTGADLVILAAGAALPTAQTRTMSNALRYGRRPGRAVMVELLRTGLILGGVTAAMVAGGGVRAALAAQLAAGMVAVGVTAVLIRHDIRPGFSRTDARGILRRGVPIYPIALSNWTMMNADVFVLSLYASPVAVATYNVAASLARISAYAAGAFMRAWGPLTTSPLHAAVDQRQGRTATCATTLTYFVIFAGWLIVGMSASAALLVRIAGDRYSAAAPLVPVIGGIFVLRMTFILSYHGSERQDRRRWLFGLFVAAAVLYVAWSIVLVPRLGAWGAATAGNAAFGFATVVMLVTALRGPDPMPLPWRRLLGALALTAVLLTALAFAPQLGGSASVSVDIASVVAYPLAALLLGIVPTADLRVIASGARGLLPARAVPAHVRREIVELEPDAVALLDAALCRREPIDLLANRLGVDEDNVRWGLLTVLRRLSTLSPGAPLDVRMADYVVDDDSFVQHVATGHRLVGDGCDPFVLDALYETSRAVRRVRLPTSANGGAVAADQHRTEPAT